MHDKDSAENDGYLWMNAIASGRLELVEASMTERTCPMPSGRPAIISAAEAGNTPLVALLLSQEKTCATMLEEPRSCTQPFTII